MNNSILLYIIILIFVGCAKDKIPKDIAYSHFEGTFLTGCDFNLSDDWGWENRSWDNVISTRFEGDNLIVQGIVFEIESAIQTEFEKVDPSTGEIATLTFTNEYQTIYLDIFRPSQNFGPQIHIIYAGNSTTLLPSVYPETNSNSHPYKDEIEGQYVMLCTKTSMNGGLDTTYIDTLTVTMNNESSFSIDNTVMDFGQFHKRYSKSIINNNVYWTGFRAITWGDDSLYLEVSDYMTHPAAKDTSTIRYSGVKI